MAMSESVHKIIRNNIHLNQTNFNICIVKVTVMKAFVSFIPL